MKVKNLHQMKSEPVHSGNTAAWTLFRSEDMLSDILFFNDNLIQPGVTIEPHQHENVEEVYYILNGIVEMRIGEEGREVSQGDAIYLSPRKTHSLQNIGNYLLRFVCVGAEIKRK